MWRCKQIVSEMVAAITEKGGVEIIKRFDLPISVSAIMEK